MNAKPTRLILKNYGQVCHHPPTDRRTFPAPTHAPCISLANSVTVPHTTPCCAWPCPTYAAMYPACLQALLYIVQAVAHCTGSLFICHCCYVPCVLAGSAVQHVHSPGHCALGLRPVSPTLARREPSRRAASLHAQHKDLPTLAHPTVCLPVVPVRTHSLRVHQILMEDTQDSADLHVCVHLRRCLGESWVPHTAVCMHACMAA